MESKYYHHIPGLLVPKDELYSKINARINNFINTIPDLIRTIEKNYSQITIEKRKEFFCRNMEVLILLLVDVYARNLETEAGRILKYAQSEDKFSALEKLFRSFVVNILTLSIEMQKAQYMNLVALNNSNEAKKPSPESNVNDINPVSKEKADNTKLIMAVDDKPEILSFVNNLLKEHYKVIPVNNGEIAAKVLDTHKPDLFILDIDMPGMNGYALAKIIRSSPGHANTPILFLTGNATREHVAKAIGSGGNDFIVKPAKPDMLLMKVDKFLNT
ncbi:MAG: response regulator [Lachnospiraceae bacterium]|nr:response regulator [Lachnospiraceae bacterium]